MVFSLLCSINHVLEWLSAFTHLLNFLLCDTEVDAVVCIPAWIESKAAVASDWGVCAGNLFAALANVLKDTARKIFRADALLCSDWSK